MANMIPSDTGADSTQSVQQPTQSAANPTAATQQPSQPTATPSQQPAPAAANAPQGAGTPGAVKPPAGTPGAPQAAPTGVPPALQPAAQVHPSIQRAGVLRSIAETLAGGPRYTYSTDVNTGTMTKQAVPMSRKDIGLAIALEAISGSLTGMAQKGPNSAFVGGEKAFQQGEQQVQQRNDKDKQEADQDLARHYQVLETNLKLYNSALQAGRMDQDNNEKYVGQFADTVKNIQDNFPGAIKGIVDEQDMAKYHVTKDTAIPYKVVPALDPNTGKQAVDGNGVPRWQIQYAVIDPSITGNFFTPDELKEAASYGLPWAKALMGASKDGTAEGLPEDLSTKITFYLNAKSQLAAIKMAQPEIDNYYGAINQGAGATSAPTVTPTIPDKGASKGIQPLVDQHAKAAGVPTDFARAVIFQESGGNPKATGANTSSGTAKGLGQLKPAAQEQYGVKDPYNPDDNLNGTMKYLHSMLNQYSGDYLLAYAAYKAGPGRVPPGATIQEVLPKLPKDSRDAVNDFAKKLGIDLTATGNKAKYPVPDFVSEIKADPMLAEAWQKYVYILNSTADGSGKVNYQKALAEMASGGQGRQPNPTGAAKIMRLFGGQQAMQDYEQQAALQEAKNKADIEVQEANIKNEQKTAADASAADAMSNMIRGPENFTFKPEFSTMGPDALRNSLQQQGVEIPENFDALYKVAKYQASDADFANRAWRKGDPTAMRRDEANSFITRYINPDFKEYEYNTIATAVKQAHSVNDKMGATIWNAGTTTGHLNMLMNVINQLPKIDAGGRLTLLNRIAVRIGAETGNSIPAVAKAIGEKVNQEVEKVAAGGSTPYADSIERGLQNIDAAGSLDQLRGTLKAYTGLMASRMGSTDEEYSATTGSHLDNVSPEATALFFLNGMGSEVTWAQPPVPGAQPLINKGGINPRFVGWLLPDGKTRVPANWTPPANQGGNGASQ